MRACVGLREFCSPRAWKHVGLQALNRRGARMPVHESLISREYGNFGVHMEINDKPENARSQIDKCTRAKQTQRDGVSRGFAGCRIGRMRDFLVLGVHNFAN